jgi:hypothetical protein
VCIDSLVSKFKYAYLNFQGIGLFFFYFLIQFQFVYWLYSINFSGHKTVFFLSLFNSSLNIKNLIEWFSFIKSDIKFLFRWKLWDQNETWRWLNNISINYKFILIVAGKSVVPCCEFLVLYWFSIDLTFG